MPPSPRGFRISYRFAKRDPGGNAPDRPPASNFCLRSPGVGYVRSVSLGGSKMSVLKPAAGGASKRPVATSGTGVAVPQAGHFASRLVRDTLQAAQTITETLRIM